MPSPRIADVSAVQPENAEFPIKVTLSGRMTEVREVQSANAQFSMETTLFGMDTKTSAVHALNAESPITRIPCGISQLEPAVKFG